MSEQMETKSTLKRNILMLGTILLGGVLIVVAPLLKSPPKQNSATENPLKVRSLIVPQLDIVPSSTGFGRVIPMRTWESVTEVSGQVVWIAEELRDGNIVAAGMPLLRIEDANYLLILAQIEAQLLASDVKRKTANDSLSIAGKNLKSLQTEFQRQKKLAAKGTVSKTALDSSERQLLAGQTQVENLQNSLELISAENKVLLAQKVAAELDVKRTVTIAPFDARITKVNVGIAQYANKGQLLFTADGLEVAEIEAQFSIGTLRPLIRGTASNNEAPIRPGVIGLNALVRLRSASHTVEWSARIDRVSGNVDPLTQNIGVIVAVDKPYARSNPGERPPLLRDTFVEVELSSDPIKQQIVIPSIAVHDSTINSGTVYVVNKDYRLEMREVKIDFIREGYAVVSFGLNVGEQIIITDLIMATEGMLLIPQEDKKSLQRMIFQATGQGNKL